MADPAAATDAADDKSAPAAAARGRAPRTNAFFVGAPLVVLGSGVLIVATSRDRDAVAETLHVYGWIILTLCIFAANFVTCMFCLNRSASMASRTAAVMVEGGSVCVSMLAVVALFVLGVASMYATNRVLVASAESGPIGAVRESIGGMLDAALEYLATPIAYAGRLAGASSYIGRVVVRMRGASPASVWMSDARWAQKARGIASSLYTLDLANATIVRIVVEKIGMPALTDAMQAAHGVLADADVAELVGRMCAKT